MRSKVIKILQDEMMLVVNLVNMSNLCFQLVEDQEKQTLVATETKTEGEPIVCGFTTKVAVMFNETIYTYQMYCTVTCSVVN